MAESKKASELIREKTGVDQADYALMEHNARRYAMTDAEVEEAVLKQLIHHPKVEEVMKNGTVGLKMLIDQNTPIEFGKSKTFNARNVLAAVGAPFEDDGRYETPEEKLVALYRTNPGQIRNAVYRDKDFGDWGSQNLDKLVYAAANYKKPKPEVGAGHTVAGTFFYPRSLEAMEAGRSPSAKDIIGDVGEDILMAIPVGAGAAALASKLPRAAKAAAIIGSNFAVPSVTEIYDANVYNPDENLDRSVGQWVDPITGGVTNIVAPYIGGRLVGRGSRMLGLHPSQRGVNIPSGGSQDAKAIVDGWLKKGSYGIPTVDEQRMTRDFLLDDYMFRKEGDKAYDAALAGADAFDHGIINEATQKAAEQTAKYAEEGAMLAKKGEVAAGFMHAGDDVEEALRKTSALSDDVINELFHRIKVNDGKMTKRDLLTAIGESFIVNRYGSQRHADAGLSMIGSFIPQSVDFDPSEKLDELRDERKKNAESNYRRSMAAKVLTDIDMAPQSEQSDADVKWLSEIYANPSIVTGKGIGGTAEFKNWWNTRGVMLFGNYNAFPGIKK